MIDLRQITLDILPLIKDVGTFIKSNLGVDESKIETKEHNSLVSYVDKEAENMLVKGLSQILPEAGFITEEDTEDVIANKDYVWIIDPLDGTTNFLHQIPFFAVSVALFDRHNKGLIGIVYEVNREEMFYAWQGGGAYLDESPISVSDKSLADSLLATGFPYSTFEQEENYYRIFRALTKSCRGIRRIGAAALDLAYVACGRFDGFFEYSLHIWDIAGGIVLIQEAGGQVTDLKGEDNWFSAWSILAANPKVHREVDHLVNERG